MNAASKEGKTEVQRFEPSDNCGCCIESLRPHPEGYWVQYEDWYELNSSHDDLLKALEEIVQRNEIQHWFNLDQAKAAIARAKSAPEKEG